VDRLPVVFDGPLFSPQDLPEDMSKAVEYFRQATEKDPNYALAYAMLADTYAVIADTVTISGRATRLGEKARAAAAKRWN